VVFFLPALAVLPIVTGCAAVALSRATRPGPVAAVAAIGQLVPLAVAIWTGSVALVELVAGVCVPTIGALAVSQSARLQNVMPGKPIRSTMAAWHRRTEGDRWLGARP
jgi:hypothetical protein